MDSRYYNKYAVAAVRGALKRAGKQEMLRAELMEKELDALAEKECDEILEKAEVSGVKLYHFKATHSDMPRVKKVLGFLRGTYFESLLDVGSGRGVFLIPFMESFPYASVTSLDILDKRIEMLEDIRNGGASLLSTRKADVCAQPFPDRSFDVVTMLEVLEHIPDTCAAIRSAVKMARKYVVVTVPSKEDDNPEHIHLLTKSKLAEYFEEAGITKLSFDGVPGHLFMIARVD